MKLDLNKLLNNSRLIDNQYAYNTANQINQIAELTQTKNFSYDNVDRLTSMNNGTTNESYAFDGVGNRTSSHLSNIYNYQPFNRMTSTASKMMAYDANGNMTSRTDVSGGWIYAWDYENRMTSATNGTNSVFYAYDALGRRVKRTEGANITKFTYDGLDVVMDDDNGVLTKYQNGLGIDNKLKLTSGGVSEYFLQDHLGSTVGLADSSGTLSSSASYDSFGNSANNLTTRYQFTGREYDAFTGLHYYRNRWYDANLGRFISEDPIGFSGGDINIYSYGKNNPLQYFDPLGLDVEVVFSRSQGKITVKENWGGWGIWDWWYGPKSNNEFNVFSGDCNKNCSETSVGGPVPKGLYLIDKDHDVKGNTPWKQISYRLYASQSDTMAGPFKPQKEVTDPNTGQKIIRDNFYIHPGSVSLGCVTFQKDSNLPSGAPWSSDYERFDGILQGTSPIFVNRSEFAGKLTVID